MYEIEIKDHIESPFISRTQSTPASEKDTGFGNVLKEAIGEVDKLQKEAGEAINDMVVGKERDIHKTMIALEKAEVSFQLMMQVRNKIISAYEEVMRMQV